MDPRGMVWSLYRLFLPLSSSITCGLHLEALVVVAVVGLVRAARIKRKKPFVS